MAPPGKPKITSTPCISRLFTRACAPVSSISLAPFRRLHDLAAALAALAVLVVGWPAGASRVSSSGNLPRKQNDPPCSGRSKVRRRERASAHYVRSTRIDARRALTPGSLPDPSPPRQTGRARRRSAGAPPGERLRHELAVRPSPAVAHHLPEQEARHLLVAGEVPPPLGRVRLDDLVDEPVELARIEGLVTEPPGDLAGVAALVEQGGEDGLRLGGRQGAGGLELEEGREGAGVEVPGPLRSRRRLVGGPRESKPGIGARL